MERTRVAGIVPLGDGFVFMHRKGVLKSRDYQEYYTFPGGRLEEGETPEEGTVREIEEEFGIHIKVVKKWYEIYSEKFNRKEIFFLCEYMDGEFGTGTGPEFSNDPNYVDCGEYLPEIVKKEDVPKLVILPSQVKEKFVEDFCK